LSLVSEYLSLLASSDFNVCEFLVWLCYRLPPWMAMELTRVLVHTHRILRLVPEARVLTWHKAVMDSDPFSIVMDVAMFDDHNPIMDWFYNSRSEFVPTLDEYVDSETESANPSRFNETYFPKKSW
jgi:hypothetical protein